MTTITYLGQPLDEVELEPAGEVNEVVEFDYVKDIIALPGVPVEGVSPKRDFIKIDNFIKQLLGNSLAYPAKVKTLSVNTQTQESIYLINLGYMRNDPEKEVYFRILRGESDTSLFSISFGDPDQYIDGAMVFDADNNQILVQLVDFIVDNIKSNSYVQIGEYDGDPLKGRVKIDADGNLLRGTGTAWEPVGGGSGDGTVKKVNSVDPDETGNVTIGADNIDPSATRAWFTSTDKTELNTATSNVATLTTNVMTLGTDIAALVTATEALDERITDLTFDDIGNGTTNKAYTNTEKLKLAGIEAGATAYTDERAIEASLTDVTEVNEHFADGDTIKTAIGKLQGQIDAGFVKGIKTITAATYTVTADDNNMLILFDRSTAITVTLPASITDTNFNFDYANINQGEVSFIKAIGDTATLIGNTLAAQYAQGRVRRSSTTSWLLAGGTKLEAVSKELFVASPDINVFTPLGIMEDNFTITQIALRVGSGTYTVSARVNPNAPDGERSIGTSADLTITSGVTSQPLIVTAISNNVLALGDELGIRFTDISVGGVNRAFIQFIGYRKVNVW